MLIKRRKESVPELNTTSTADISFMLLIFFLVTTSMNIDKGLKRQLPPPLPEEEINERDVERNNIIDIAITSDNRFMLNNESCSLAQLKNKLPDLIRERKAEHIIRITADKDSHYEAYFRLQNVIVLIYRELRNDFLKTKYHTTLSNCTESQLEEVQSLFPQRITENIEDMKGEER